jgi:hypothetical protein
MSDTYDNYLEVFYLLGYNANLFHAGFLLILYFDPEDRGTVFLLNVGCL